MCIKHKNMSPLIPPLTYPHKPLTPLPTPCGTLSQANFDTNKKNFMALLMSKIEAKLVKQGTEDADVLIIQTAFSQTRDFDSVIIIEENIDLLVWLTALVPSKNNIYIQKSCKGNILCY